MKNTLKQTRSFTLAEILITVAVASILGIGLLIYGHLVWDMFARNLATNHSHETARGSFQKLATDLHGAASNYTLASYTGGTGYTAFTDLSASAGTLTATSGTDPIYNVPISNRANAIHFLQWWAGPSQLTSVSGTIAPTSGTLTFNYTPPASHPTYYPAAGDVVAFPLLDNEFDIVSASTSGSTLTITIGKITSAPGAPIQTDTSSASNYQIGFTIYTGGVSTLNITGTSAASQSEVTTGYFYHRVGYSVWNKQLWYHQNYPPADKSALNFAMIRDNVTSPYPFSILVTSTSTALTSYPLLRVSLESYDMTYSSRLFQNSTTTLNSVFSSYNIPLPLTGN